MIPESIVNASDLGAALEAAVAHFKADSGTVHLTAEDGTLHLRAATKGIPEPVLQIVRVVPVGKGMAGLAVERVQPVTACNIQTDSSGDVRPGAKLTGLEGAIVVPMLRDGVPYGALGIANRTERTFTGEETSALLEIGALLAAKYG
ncbi:MAG: GAF domain-containing protein [Acidobacteria bacterium]|nr:GAF domain-containing protein [Acidobacteriota bacterium]